MLRYSKLYNKPVFAPKQGRRGTRTDADGQEEQVLRKVGRVRHAVFTPDGQRLVGLLVKRPDTAGMFKREELFLGVDSFEAVGKGIHVTRGDESFDDAARERLGVEWERCIMWAGMDAKTTDGKELGYVNDAEFAEATGVVTKFYVGDDGLSQSLVGSVEIPASMVRGYERGFMLVDPEAKSLGLNGGLAGAAGEAVGKAQVGAAQAQEKVVAGTVEAIDSGSRGLGKMIGDTKRAFQAEAGEPKKATSGTDGSSGSAKPAPKKKPTGDGAARAVGRQLGKFGSMFGSFADEYKKASK